MKHLVASVLILALSGCTAYRLTPAIPYAAAPVRAFDVYEPIADSKTPRPVLLALHPGGWTSGDRSWAKAVADRYCPRGYVVVGVSYRLASEAARWPAQRDDLRAAVDHVVAISDRFGIDVNRIGTLGVSAGGHLAADLVLGDPRVAVAVVANAPTDLRLVRSPAGLVAVQALLGPDAGADQILAASPVTHVAVSPPVSVLVVSSDSDPVVDPLDGPAFARALAGAGHDVDSIRVDDDCHSGCWRRFLVDLRVAAWLRRRLID